MKRNKGLRLGCKLGKVVKCFIHRRKKPRATYRRSNHQPSCAARALSMLGDWGRSLIRGAKGICLSRPGSGYIRVEKDDPFEKNPVCVPKGHLAVYVGEEEDDACRVLVPVMFFNHPLFGDLLRQAEKVYGFDRPGGIQIPCRISDFENVKTRIAAAGRDDGF